MERDVSPPKGFKGTLDWNEKWFRCPYFPDHKYLRPIVHLPNCRLRYQAMKEGRDEDMDIIICQFNWDHHVHESKLEEHEANCKDGVAMKVYLKNYFERTRGTEVAKKKEKKEKEEEGKKMTQK